MMKNKRQLAAIKGKTFCFTGFTNPERKDLRDFISSRRCNGKIVRGISKQVDFLIRGYSSAWKHEKYGNKEEVVARLVRAGYDVQVITDENFANYFEGRSKKLKCETSIANIDVLELKNSVNEPEFLSLRRYGNDLDAITTVRARKEQAFLRNYLFKNRTVAICSICGIEYPTQFLVVSHIKPRNRCSLPEKRDYKNVVAPMCLFGCDALFEKGFISVNGNGKIISLRKFKSLNQYVKRLNSKCDSWNSQSAKYFDWHFNWYA